jgi:threonylcarbamoyladenosine tRNA methylthiotransferase MtaB
MSGVEVVNFGCRLNIAEGEGARQAAAASGANNLIIFNTCAVTAEAERQAAQAIRAAARAQPDRRIVVTGCAAEVSPDRFLAIEGVSAVIGNQDKREARAYAPSVRTGLTNIFSVKRIDKPLVSGEGNSRAHIEVQNGCDHRCTFCIIPFGRGNSRSASVAAIVEAAQKAVDDGKGEIVLTGVDLTSYGADLPDTPTLGVLVEQLLKVEGLSRLRLSSLDCIEIDDRLFEFVTSEARVMPHLHLSLQSGDDMILKRMKRRHNRAEAVELVQRIKAKRPEIAIGADLIAGFPTETNEMFANTIAIIDDCDIVHGHIFPYSPRPGTPAARMPQLDRALIKDRARILRGKAREKRSNWLASLKGTRQRVLVEKDQMNGHAENYAPVRLLGAVAAGTIVEVQVDAIEDGVLIGKAA